jgi:hypothetical protein
MHKILKISKKPTKKPQRSLNYTLLGKKRKIIKKEVVFYINKKFKNSFKEHKQNILLIITIFNKKYPYKLKW